MHKKSAPIQSQGEARKTSTVPPMAEKPFPLDMRKSFCRFVRHMLQNISTRLDLSSLFTDTSRKEFSALLKQLDWTGSTEEAKEAIENILSFLAKLKSTHNRTEEDPFRDDDDRGIFFRSIYLSELYINKVLNILIGGPHMLVREDISLERILGDTAPLIGANGAGTADCLFEQFTDLPIDEMAKFLKTNPDHPVSKLMNGNPMSLKGIVAAQAAKKIRPGGRKTFEIFYDHPVSDVVLNVDRIEAFLLFENLLSNALRAGATRVDVTAKKSKTQPGMAEISIKNDGNGFTPRQLKMANAGKSFSTKKKGNGQINGIGLIHCRFIVDQHGGTFHIESKGGKGAEITLTLPLSKQK